jgi:hypothetical protein
MLQLDNFEFFRDTDAPRATIADARRLIDVPRQVRLAGRQVEIARPIKYILLLIKPKQVIYYDILN